MKYAKVGCFGDKRNQRTLKDLVFQDRYEGRTFRDRFIDWMAFDVYACMQSSIGD